MSIIQRFIEDAKGRSLRVVLPEGQDERIVAAARRLKDERIAEPILLGKRDEIAAAARAAGVSLDGLAVIDPSENEKLDDYAAAYVAGRALDVKIARRMVKRPLYYGGMMVARGDAHAMVAGNPARRIGWICACGKKLPASLRCGCGRAYRVASEVAGLVTRTDARE